MDAIDRHGRPARTSHELARIVCVACVKDLDTWRVVSRRLLESIAASTYEVVVPRRDLCAFERESPAAFRVVAEEEHLAGHSLDSIARALPVAVRDRAGWYLQQFVKLGASSVGEPHAINLIWDGDTVPMRRLEFVGGSGRLQFYSSAEYHRPYFQTLERILGLPRATDRSFIAQCMPTRVRWVREMTAEIERRCGRPWIDAVLASVPGHDPSEFSEYESLGQFVFQRHPDEAEFTDRAWQRYGNSRVGGIESLTPETIAELATRFDFVSFEGWDRRKPPPATCQPFDWLRRKLRVRRHSRYLDARRLP